MSVYKELLIEAKYSTEGILVDGNNNLKVHKVGKDGDGDWFYQCAYGDMPDKKYEIKHKDLGLDEDSKITNIRMFNNPTTSKPVSDAISKYAKKYIKNNESEDGKFFSTKLNTVKLFEGDSLPPKMVAQYETRAKHERQGGGNIDIDYSLPSISVTMSSGEDYFFQEHEAQELLDGVPENISAEDFILAQAQGW